MAIKTGSIVRFTDSFLLSIACFTPPINGIVLRLADNPPRAIVWWCDAPDNYGRGALLSNIEIAPEDNTISDGMRDSLLTEATSKATLTSMSIADYMVETKQDGAT